mmetsp:Transcript_21921/g.68664  ORF Transcript_21921/g.68664 Transcript_21921/m.68664 type:complete len:215 (-) Transcript_21921:334-978(-)
MRRRRSWKHMSSADMRLMARPAMGWTLPPSALDRALTRGSFCSRSRAASASSNWASARGTVRPSRLSPQPRAAAAAPGVPWRSWQRPRAWPSRPRRWASGRPLRATRPRTRPWPWPAATRWWAAGATGVASTSSSGPRTGARSTGRSWRYPRGGPWSSRWSAMGAGAGGSSRPGTGVGASSGRARGVTGATGGCRCPQTERCYSSSSTRPASAT